MNLDLFISKYYLAKFKFYMQHDFIKIINDGRK